MANKTIRTKRNRQAVIDHLSAGLSINGACSNAGIGRTAFFDWRTDDAEFAAEVGHAIESGTDRLEDIAMQRAEGGSDSMIQFLLKARRREKYGDRQALEHSGPNGAPMTIVFAERSDGPA